MSTAKSKPNKSGVVPNAPIPASELTYQLDTVTSELKELNKSIKKERKKQKKWEENAYKPHVQPVQPTFISGSPCGCHKNPHAEDNGTSVLTYISDALMWITVGMTIALVIYKKYAKKPADPGGAYAD